MAYDAGMLAAAIAQISDAALGARIEKIYQPERDEIILQMRSFEGGRRLLINAGSNNARLGFTTTVKENPATPPNFCMLLRKHLSGAKLAEIAQEGFERVARLTFEARDEMGFPCRRTLIAEVMGKYSNLIFTDENERILAVLRPVDFTTSSRRQVLPGMTYELPPRQDKTDPREVGEEEFTGLFAAAPSERACEKWLTATFLGLSAAVAREMVFRATGATDTLCGACGAAALFPRFDEVMTCIRTRNFAPALYLDGERPVEYAFLPLTQYAGRLRVFEGSAGEVLDRFFATRDREEKVKQRANDILHLLTSAEARLHKKLELQRGELAECERGAEYKRAGDLITANLGVLSRGMTLATLTDYEDYHEEDGSYGHCTIALDSRLTPAANAQRYYKKYAKSKTAKQELTRQIGIGEQELAYISNVFQSLSQAETENDLNEIRDELYRSGYASRMKRYRTRRESVPSVMQFRTSGGLRVLCGKNNVQNEYITHHLADKNDYWFHAKGVPGSHVVLVCGGQEPPAADLTEAAEIAAYYSRAQGGQNVAVDYTPARNVKKVPGGKAGLVIYHTNYSAYVTPSAEAIAARREKDTKK